MSGLAIQRAKAVRRPVVRRASGRKPDVLIGSIAAGKAADIIAVSGDPLTNVRELESVDFVMKGGKVYKD